MLYTAFQFGAALGLALVTIVLVGGSHGAASPDDYRVALLVPTALAAGAAITVVAAMAARRRRSPDRDLEDAELCCVIA